MEKITLDMLTQNSVSVKKQQFTTVDGVEYLIGDPWRRTYYNSTIGRAQVQSEVADPFKTAIMTIWGNNSTVAQ